MRKKIALVLIILLITAVCLSACNLDFTGNNCKDHIDSDGDGLCDNCSKSLEILCGFHIDSNKDGYCDNCYTKVNTPCTNHIDSNGDGKCDKCGATVSIDCQHIDEDNDSTCDKCGVAVTTIPSVETVVDIYSINDLHGKYLDSATQPGVDELTTYLKQRQNEENAILLSAGDMWQGTMESGLTYGELITKWMNELDFVSMTLGNHEFDWGEEYIQSNFDIADFPFLAINVYDTTTNALEEYCTPSITIDIDEMTIGIIGAIGNCHDSISGEFSQGVYFKTGGELATLVKNESTRLRSQGADFIVYVLHDGTSGYDNSLSNGYVDLVFEGHTHQQYITQDNYGVYHIQGKAENNGISHAEITFSTNGDVEVDVEYISNAIYDKEDPHSIVNALYNEYKHIIGNPNEIVGYNASKKDDAVVEQKIADLYCEVGEQKWGQEYDIVLGGGFLKTRSPYDLAQGDVTRAMLYSLLTFNNTIQLCSIKGSDLQDKFINTTNYDYYISYTDYGNGVKNNINPNDIYYIVVDSYTSQYKPNRLTVIDNYADNVYSRDLLADYISTGAWKGSFVCSSHIDTNEDSWCDRCRTCTHIYDNNCDGVCNNCGKTRIVVHTYSFNCDNTCDICSHQRSAEPHTYDNACDATCNVCGEIRETTHVYDNCCDTTCNQCGAVRVTTHVYDDDNDTTCNECGEIREADCNHIYDNSCDKDCNLCGNLRETSHAYDNNCDTSCNVCGEIRIVIHVYDDNQDATCNICGEVRVVDCEHEYSNVCDVTCNLCGESRVVAGHTYDNDCDKTCNLCGETRETSHVYDNACDTTCNVCSNQRETTHSYDNSCDTTCNVCGSVRATNHTYDNACDTQCNICFALRTIEHTYTDNCDDICNICGDSRIPPHTDSNRDYYCDNCSGVIEIECKVHVDVNTDGLCDKCTIQYATTYSQDVVVDIYSINDLHGKYLDSDAQPGVDEMTTYLKQKQDDENAILLSAGDMWQGTMESGLTKGALMTKWMNEVGFSAMILGNHEFDWGDEYISNNQALAEFPFLAINVYVDATNTLADYCTPSVMLYVDGVTIGVIGAIGNCESSISSQYVSEVSFKVGDELTSLVKAESNRLRGIGADYIVYVLHDTYKTSRSYDTALSNGYVDLVFEGHSHAQYVYQDSYGVYHLQGYAENQGLSHAEITFKADNTISVTADYVGASTYSSASYESSPLVDKLFEEYESVVGDPYAVIGTNSTNRTDAVIEQKVADLYMEYGVAKWGTQYDIVLGGGFLKTRSPYSLSAGNVTRAMLYSLLTFDNNVQLCSITGSYLKSKFINTSNADYYITYSDYGESIKDSIVDDATYYVIVDSYTSQYAPNKLTVVEDYTPSVYARDLLEEFIASGGWS